MGVKENSKPCYSGLFCKFCRISAPMTGSKCKPGSSCKCSKCSGCTTCRHKCSQKCRHLHHGAKSRQCHHHQVARHQLQMQVLHHHQQVQNCRSAAGSGAAPPPPPPPPAPAPDAKAAAAAGSGAAPPAAGAPPAPAAPAAPAPDGDGSANVAEQYPWLRLRAKREEQSYWREGACLNPWCEVFDSHHGKEVQYLLVLSCFVKNFQRIKEV